MLRYLTLVITIFAGVRLQWKDFDWKAKEPAVGTKTLNLFANSRVAREIPEVTGNYFAFQRRDAHKISWILLWAKKFFSKISLWRNWIFYFFWRIFKHPNIVLSIIFPSIDQHSASLAHKFIFRGELKSFDCELFEN